MLAGGRGTITLIEGADVAIIGTGRAGVAGRMLAGGRGAITLIEGADVAIIGTGRAGSLELTRGGATVTGKDVAVVTLFAGVKDTVATSAGRDLGHKSIGVAAAESRLQRMRRGEVVRIGLPRDMANTGYVS